MWIREILTCKDHGSPQDVRESKTEKQKVLKETDEVTAPHTSGDGVEG